MWKLVFRVLSVAACLALLSVNASAQTSTISGTVKDTSGGVLPGVTIDVSSPALIEKVRTAVTDNDGKYSVVSLRPGVYSVTFTLPGFGIVKREGIELTSDFTAVINAEMKVGTLEETITVTGESPIVDTQGITQRVVMTREVMDVLPTGRNIQAVGILIPGTSLAVGGGGALSRDVGGSGQMQQSPLQYRGSGDTVQTIEGIRLNNLCAQGAYSGVYWNDASFEEFSYVTGADSGDGPGRHAREHGAARRRQPVPRPVHGELCGRGLRIGQLQARLERVLHAVEPDRKHDVQPEQPAHERRRNQEGLRHQPVDRRADQTRQSLVLLHVPEQRHGQDESRQLLRFGSVAVPLRT